VVLIWGSGLSVSFKSFGSPIFKIDLAPGRPGITRRAMGVRGEMPPKARMDKY